MTTEKPPERVEAARRAALQLLDRRSDQATVCPSEIARAITVKTGDDPQGQSWRAVMPVVHAAIDRMVEDGQVELRWKGNLKPSRSGPYRIRRA